MLVHTTGKQTNRKGEVYEGDLRYGMREGRGTLRYGDGEVYEGQFRNNFPEGKGKLTKKNGDIYEGDWRRGKEHGKGTLIHEGGRKMYKGAWKEGKRHGEGKEMSREDDTVVCEGQWEKGELVLPSVIQL